MVSPLPLLVSLKQSLMMKMRFFHFQYSKKVNMESLMSLSVNQLLLEHTVLYVQ